MHDYNDSSFLSGMPQHVFQMCKEKCTNKNTSLHKCVFNVGVAQPPLICKHYCSVSESHLLPKMHHKLYMFSIKGSPQHISISWTNVSDLEASNVEFADHYDFVLLL